MFDRLLVGPASLEFDGEGLLGGDLPIIVLDFPLANMVLRLRMGGV